MMSVGGHIARLCAAAIVGAMVVFTLALFMPSEPAHAANGNNYDQNLTVSTTKARATQGMALMGRNGLLDAIKRQGGGLEKELQAIALRESDGNLGAENKASMAYCAFQVYHTKVAEYAKKKNMSYEAYRNALMTSPDVCAEAGAAILRDHISKQGPIGGYCGYGGEYEIFKRTGTCPIYNHVRIFKAAIDGTLTYEVITDINSPDYAKTIVRDSAGEVAVVLNCHDYEEEFARGLAKAQEAYTAALYADMDETAAVQIGKMTAEPLRYQKGRILDTYCLGIYLDYLQAIRLLLRGASIIEAFLSVLMNKLLEAVCEYVIAFVQDAVLSMLNGLCIVLPDINLRLDLKGLSRKTCGGNALSLSDLLRTGYGVDLKEMFKPDGVPPVNSFPTMIEGSAPGLPFDLRRK